MVRVKFVSAVLVRDQVDTRLLVLRDHLDRLRRDPVGAIELPEPQRRDLLGLDVPVELSVPFLSASRRLGG